MGPVQREKDQHTEGEGIVHEQGGEQDPGICWNRATGDFSSKEGNLHEVDILTLLFVQYIFTE